MDTITLKCLLEECLEGSDADSTMRTFALQLIVNKLISEIGAEKLRPDLHQLFDKIHRASREHEGKILEAWALDKTIGAVPN